MEEFSHLDDSAVAVLNRPLEDKLAAVRLDNYVPHARSEEILDAINGCMKLPRGPRRQSVIVAADSGLGKTHLIVELMRQMGVSVSNSADKDGNRPIFYMDCSAIGTRKEFENRFFDVLGCSSGPPKSIFMGCRLLCLSRTRVIVFDETHRLRRIRPAKDFEIVMDNFVLICNTAEIPMIVLGDVNVADLFYADRHLRSRFRLMTLGVWKSPEELRPFVDSLVARYPFPKPSPINDDTTLETVLKYTGGVTQHIVSSLRMTAEACLVKKCDSMHRRDWIDTLKVLGLK